MNLFSQKTTAIILPFTFIFFNVFFFHTSLNTYLLSALALVLIELALWQTFFSKNNSFKTKLATAFPFILITLGAVGLTASTILTLEKIELIKNPDHVTPCSLSPVVACSPIINSDEASAFGDVPNPLIGIFAFACLITAGMTLAAVGGTNKVKAAWWWRTLVAGTYFGVGFCGWLAYESLYDIGSLCIFCMTVWLTSLIVSYYSSLQAYYLGHLGKKSPKFEKFINKFHHSFIPIVIVLTVVTLIYLRFDDYWNDLI